MNLTCQAFVDRVFQEIDANAHYFPAIDDVLGNILLTGIYEQYSIQLNGRKATLQYSNRLETLDLAQVEMTEDGISMLSNILRSAPEVKRRWG